MIVTSAYGFCCTSSKWNDCSCIHHFTGQAVLVQHSSSGTPLAVVLAHASSCGESSQNNRALQNLSINFCTYYLFIAVTIASALFCRWQVQIMLFCTCTKEHYLYSLKSTSFVLAIYTLLSPSHTDCCKTSKWHVCW